MTDPASIRYNNPGAMWGGNALTRKWGETRNVALNDGKGQGNTIAFFPSKVIGACAQFDLWRSSKNYRNKRLADAIRTWSGGNSWAQYVAFLTARVPGLTASTVIDEAYLKSVNGIALMKAQAWHEAGREYPMTDAEWALAQTKVFGQPSATKSATAVVVTTAAAAGGAAKAGWSGAQIAALVMTMLALGLVGYLVMRARSTRSAA